MAQDRISVTVLTGPEILARITARQWRSLAQRIDDSPYFMQYEMVVGYLTHLRPEDSKTGASAAEPLALLLKRNGIAAGVLVLERDHVTVSGLRLPALSLLVHPHAPQSDLLLARDESLADYWPEIVAALSARDVRWEVIRCPAARTSSAAWRESRSAALSHRVIAHHVGHADYFDCTKGYAALEAAYGASLRRRLGQASRQLARTGKIEYSCVRGGTEGSAEAFEKFLELEGAGWKGSQGTAILQSSALRAHYQQFYGLDTDEAWAEVHLMTLEGKVIAAQFCIVSGGIREVVKLAYDETLRKQSPGNVMLDHMLRISSEDSRVNSFGLVGRPPWLAEWSPSSHDVHDVWIFRRRAIARLGVLSSRLKRSAAQFLRERLRRAGQVVESAPGKDAAESQVSHAEAVEVEPAPPKRVAAADKAVMTGVPPLAPPMRMNRQRPPRPIQRNHAAEPVSRPMDLDSSRPPAGM